MAEDLADVAVGSLLSFTAVVGGVWGGVGRLRLGRAVLRVVEVEAIADVTEKPGGELLLHGFLVVAAMKRRRSVPLSFKRERTSRDSLIVVVLFTRVISIQRRGRHFLQLILELLVLSLEFDDD